MALKKYTDGEVLYADDLNNSLYEAYKFAGLNRINQLSDRSIELSADNDFFSDAYVDSNGRMNTVDESNTDALYNQDNKYYYPNFSDEASSDTTNNSDSFTNPENAFDGDDSTYAENTFTAGSTTTVYKYLTKEFSSSRYIGVCKIKIIYSIGSASGGVTAKTGVQVYDGSNWITVKEHTYNSSSASGYTFNIDEFFEVNKTIQKIRVFFSLLAYSSSTRQGDAKIYSFEYGNGIESEIYHTVSSGTFSSTISKAFLTCLVNTWEDGANIQYKLTNSTEDTGWLNYNEVSSFTAFTNEPTTLIIKLIPKSSPTVNISIKGFSLKAE